MKSILFAMRAVVVTAIAALTIVSTTSAQLGVGITVTPRLLQFLRVDLGAFGIQTFVILNTKLTGRLTGSVGGTHNSAYRIISGGGDFDLGLGESKLVTVRFDPTVAATIDDSIAITHNDGGVASPTYVHLRGEGGSNGNGAIRGAVRLDLSTNLLDFGGIRLGSMGQRQVTIVNHSDSARLNGLIGLTADASLTIESGGGAFSLAPGESRLITVRFTPSVAASANGSLKIDYSSADTTGTKTVDLTGLGLQIGNGGGGTGGGNVSDSVSASLLTQSIFFGNVQIGQMSQRDVMITNTSDTAHLMIMVGSGGMLTAPFLVTAGTSGSMMIGPGETRSVTVSFTPTSIGYFSDTLQLMTNITGSTDPLNIVIQGNAINSTGGNGGGNGGGGGSAISISSDKIEFGPMMVGQTAQLSFTITNPEATGALTINVSNPASPFFLSTSAGPMTLGPGESRTIVLNYTPSFAGTFNDNMAIQYTNGSSNGTIYMPLSGSAATVASGVDDEKAPVAGVLTTRSYPNPFTTSATIGFTLAGSEHVSLAVYDMRGDEVAVLADRTYEAGEHAVVWDARGMASGLYLLRLRTGSSSVTSYLTLTK